MRLIGTLDNEIHARRFSDYLKSKEIANSFEFSFNPATNQMSYQVWIHDEDRLDEAKKELDAFQKEPSLAKYDVAPIEPDPVIDEGPPPEPKRFKNYLTNFFLLLCIFLFFMNMGEEKKLKETKTLILTPLQEKLIFDPPPSLEAPYWRGIYDWVIAKINKTDSSLGEGPLFSKILEGEVWRAFTPVLLHNDLLHILFNMLWLWFLGRPIEQRIGSLRMLILAILTGVFANVIQYIMSGPLFFGFSGIITGLAGFIWMRERVAPWEGYPLNRATIWFLMIFIGAIFLLQLVSFFIQIFTTISFSPHIANSAHIAGALMGAFLGRFKFFAQRVHK